MNPKPWRPKPLRLVIFDCDGVLIDSEPLSRGLVAAEAKSRGWHMTEQESHALTGLTWSALKPVFEKRLGVTLPEDWAVRMQERLVPLLRSGVSAMPGARDLLLATKKLGLPYRIASNSSHAEMDEKFAATGLSALVEGRVHSARDVGRGKPAPDLFLAAAAAEGVAPQNCLVVEDSAPGIEAAHAAGMQVVAYSPGPVPLAAHALPPHAVVQSLGALPGLFEAALTETAS